MEEQRHSYEGHNIYYYEGQYILCTSKISKDDNSRQPNEKSPKLYAFQLTTTLNEPGLTQE